mmetsp:Transcript_10373/g.11489  ORF Transcript_10373/g.11489 Transcript_10373/m.11489 type:complete len:115 (+) Transcript_10373:3375-3719(+)
MRSPSHKAGTTTPKFTGGQRLVHPCPDTPVSDNNSDSTARKGTTATAWVFGIIIILVIVVQLLITILIFSFLSSLFENILREVVSNTTRYFVYQVARNKRIIFDIVIQIVSIIE